MNDVEMLNADMSLRAVVHTGEMQWRPSPSPTVWRKRVYLAGRVEAGAVTSVVRYDPGASFHQHPHPQGEEILVLSGVFSDEQGHWPAGSYLLNPEGFCHAPYSQPGCVLFVKLRQYPGLDRSQLALQTSDMVWSESAKSGVLRKVLYREEGHEERMYLEQWSPGVRFQSRRFDAGAEMFVISGSFADENGVYSQGSWLRLPAGDSHNPWSDHGCEIYLRC